MMSYEIDKMRLLNLLLLIIMSALKRSEIMGQLVAKCMRKVLFMLDLNIPYIAERGLLLYLGVSKHGYSNG